MTYPHGRSSLVDMANDQSLLIYCVVIGDEDGPPLWVKCTAEATDRLPASRTTVVRAEGEDCPSFWARVLMTIRQLKRRRGFQHRVLVDCMTTPPPADPVGRDARFNMQRALWHEVERERDSLKRVQALCALADLHKFKGALPEFG